MKKTWDKTEYIVRCSCNELWHSTLFSFMYDLHVWKTGDTPDHDLFISQNVQDVGFWERLRNCVRYLFKQRKFWNYGETYLTLNDPDNRKMVEGLIEYLQEALSISKDDVWDTK